MIYESKEESQAENAIRILTCIAEEFKNNHESTVCFDKDIVLDAINFLDYAKNEETLMNSLKQYRAALIHEY